ncbi:hypothetical protein T484DRAFT_1810488 [Baffinella frigidus]|nr:hypothetical protein T484DRAFT_1810488 [Cryptophyta sp. CCMP2293]
MVASAGRAGWSALLVLVGLAALAQPLESFATAAAIRSPPALQGSQGPSASNTATGRTNLCKVESETGSLLESFSELVGESLEGSGRQLTRDQAACLEKELEALMGENEELQRHVMRRVADDRSLMKMCARERDGDDSLFLPMSTVSDIAADEECGVRRASTAPIHGREPVSERSRLDGQQGDAVEEEEPVLVPHRGARDDVLALKLLSLLDAGADALHEASAVVDASKILPAKADGNAGVDRRSTQAQGGEASPGDILDQGAMGPHEIADALNALAMGEGSRPLGHAFRDGIEDEDDKEEIALLQSLRGGGPDSDGETAILGQSATRRHACDFNAHRLLPRLGDCAKGLAPPAGGEIVREMVNALEQFSEPVSSDSDCPSGEDTMGPWEEDVYYREDFTPPPRSKKFRTFPKLKKDHIRMAEQCLGYHPFLDPHPPKPPKDHICMPAGSDGVITVRRASGRSRVLIGGVLIGC